jgi:hypothetical protein
MLGLSGSPSSTAATTLLWLRLLLWFRFWLLLCLVSTSIHHAEPDELLDALHGMSLDKLKAGGNPLPGWLR